MSNDKEESLYSHNFGDHCFWKSAQIQILEVQCDGDGTAAALCDINFVYVQRFHLRNGETRVSIWMCLYNFCDDFR